MFARPEMRCWVWLMLQTDGIQLGTSLPAEGSFSCKMLYTRSFGLHNEHAANSYWFHCLYWDKRFCIHLLGLSALMCGTLLTQCQRHINSWLPFLETYLGFIPFCDQTRACDVEYVCNCRLFEFRLGKKLLAHMFLWLCENLCRVSTKLHSQHATHFQRLFAHAQNVPMLHNLWPHYDVVPLLCYFALPVFFFLTALSLTPSSWHSLHRTRWGLQNFFAFFILCFSNMSASPRFPHSLPVIGLILPQRCSSFLLISVHAVQRAWQWPAFALLQFHESNSSRSFVTLHLAHLHPQFLQHPVLLFQSSSQDQLPLKPPP